MHGDLFGYFNSNSKTKAYHLQSNNCPANMFTEKCFFPHIKMLHTEFCLSLNGLNLKFLWSFPYVPSEQVLQFVKVEKCPGKILTISVIVFHFLYKGTHSFDQNHEISITPLSSFESNLRRLGDSSTSSSTFRFRDKCPFISKDCSCRSSMLSMIIRSSSSLAAEIHESRKSKTAHCYTLVRLWVLISRMFNNIK